MPAGEVEIGTWGQIEANKGWMPKSSEMAFQLAKESWGWLEPSFRKIGNQISVRAIGYTKEKANKDVATAHTQILAQQFGDDEAWSNSVPIQLHLEVTNSGASA